MNSQKNHYKILQTSRQIKKIYNRNLKDKINKIMKKSKNKFQMIKKHKLVLLT